MASSSISSAQLILWNAQLKKTAPEANLNEGNGHNFIQAIADTSFKLLGSHTPDSLAKLANPGKIGVRWVEMHGQLSNGKSVYIDEVTKERHDSVLSKEISWGDKISFHTKTSWVTPENLELELSKHFVWEIIK